ncbi:fimbrillin family protein [Parabacteroides sp. PF5-6]|uniref:fimbrillin family protein n=1 Tax=Parabacteroides sp. PF5-6 TaxID=1742403 RepID=UPI002406C3B6|nr:fimbrillin family protein [Parabacteroides sp. PF5-6]MDF9829917.1 hypothetical protein [Parabacteroides sp. PF5-6]
MMINRTTYLALLLLAAALWSCSQEPVEEPVPPRVEAHPVGFLVDGNLSKGVVTTHKDSIYSLGLIGYSTEDSFDIKAKTSDPNLFDNVTAYREEIGGVSWIYDQPVYWPSNSALKNTFFAYSPYQDEFPDESITIVTDKGSPRIIYSVPEAMSEHTDLLYSVYNTDVANINYTEQNRGTVKLNMKHALLWLRFMIAAEKQSGHADEAYTVTEFNMTAGRIINTGLFDMATATWYSIPELPNGEYESVNYDFDNLEDEPLVVKADSMYPMGGVSYDHCLMIIPQSIVLSENETAVNVAFTYDTGLEDDPEKDIERYITMPFPDVKLNKPGYVMTFIVKLSTEGARITFHSSNPIAEWLEEEDDPLREIETY